jgi:hypothetical protein
MANTEENDWLRRRLDAVILLLMDALSKEPLSSAARIERLQSFGFKPAEIAKIIGKETSFVTATLAKKKNKGAAKSKKASTSPAHTPPAESSEGAA